jgi:hypothetical protein
VTDTTRRVGATFRKAIDDLTAVNLTLRERAEAADNRALESDIALSLREADLADAVDTVTALGENPRETDCWAMLKRQRDQAVKRAEAAEAIVDSLPKIGRLNGTGDGIVWDVTWQLRGSYWYTWRGNAYQVLFLSSLELSLYDSREAAEFAIAEERTA